MPRAKTPPPAASELDELFADVLIGRQMEREALAKIKRYAEEAGPVSMRGLYARISQGCFDNVYKPDLAAECIVEYYGRDLDTEAQMALSKVIATCLKAMSDPRTARNTIKGLDNAGDILSMIKNADEDEGMTTYYGEKKIDIFTAEANKGKYWSREEEAGPDGKVIWEDGEEHSKGYAQSTRGAKDPGDDYEALDDDGLDLDVDTSLGEINMDGLSPGG